MTDGPVARAMSLLGGRWTLAILVQVFLGVRRFGQIQRNLGVSRNILSARLKLLTGEGILMRRRYRRDPDLYEYRLTGRGLDLFPVVASVVDWAYASLGGEAEHTLVLRHTACGRRTELRLACSECGERLSGDEVSLEAVPAPSGHRPALRAAT